MVAFDINTESMQAIPNSNVPTELTLSCEMLIILLFGFRIAQKLIKLHLESSRSMNDSTFQVILNQNPQPFLEVLCRVVCVKIYYVSLKMVFRNHSLAKLQ